MSGTAPDTTDLEPLYRQLLQQTLQPQPVPLPQGPTASSHEGRGWLSLLGEALGGGQEYGTTAERETGGIRALGALGQRMLAASDYSYQPHTLGSIIGQGMGAAGESLAGTQSVSAARAAALQDYQDKQQAAQLARIKEAVPLLTALQTLQQQKRVAGMPSSLGSTPGTTPGTSIAATIDRDPSMTAGQQGNNSGNLMVPEGAPLPTGATGVIPLSGGRRVAAFPDAATGIAAQSDNLAAYQQTHGINTIRGAVTRWVGDPKADLTSYVADIAKAAGVDPDKPVDLSDPKIQRAFFLAQQPHESGKPWLNAADVDKGIALAQARRKGGQPPGAPAVAGAPQPPPPASTAPPAPVVGKGTPLPAGRPTGPPVITDQPPAGSATVAGPGAPTVGAPLPPSPAVAGNVNAIIGGMTGAGASPTTLAPGPAVPVPQASTQASTQPQPPPITTQPDQAPPAAGPPTFTYTRHDPPPGMLQGSKLTTEEQSVVQDARNAYQNAIRVAITPEQRQQAEATLQATLDKELTARAGRTDAAAKQMADWYASDFKQQQEAHKQAVESFYKNRDQQQQFENQQRLETAKGEQTRLTNKEAVFNQANQKGLETAQTEQANARDVVTQLEGFRAISDNVETQPGWMQTTKLPGTDQTIAERLQQAGIKMSDTAGVQLLRGGITNLVKTLRAGMPMGSLSDRDLSFVERMGPTEWMDLDTRTAAISYLQQAYKAKMFFARDVQKEMSRGKNYGDALDAVDARSKPFVPAVPADLTAHWRDPDPHWVQQRIKWAQDNDVGPGTLYHMSDGSIAVMRDPNRPKKEQR